MKKKKLAKESRRRMICRRFLREPVFLIYLLLNTLGLKRGKRRRKYLKNIYLIHLIKENSPKREGTVQIVPCILIILNN